MLFLNAFCEKISVITQRDIVRQFASITKGSLAERSTILGFLCFVLISGLGKDAFG